MRLIRLARAGEGLDWAHRTIRNGESGQQGEQGAAEHTGSEEEPETGDRVVDVGVRPRVLDIGGQRAGRGDRHGGDAELADGANAEAGSSEVDLWVRARERMAVLIEHLDLSVLGKGECPQVRAVDDRAQHGIVGHPGLGAERARRALQLLAEVAADPAPDDVAKDEGEADQDEERQARRGDGDPPANRDALEERKLGAANPAHVAPFST